MVLQFGTGKAVEDIVGDLSAATFGPDGRLWLASDELSAGQVTLSALRPETTDTFGAHQLYPLEPAIALLEATSKKAEADFEGLHFADGYLWFTGSHSTKRSRPKGKSVKKDLERLSEVKTDLNRYLLGRIPLAGDALVRSIADLSDPDRTLTAARLAEGEAGNVLTEALLGDAHLGSFLRTVHFENGRRELLPLASKENGFDIEGLAVAGRPLRGWACLLEISCVEQGEGLLCLDDIEGNKRRYRKHFLDLDGLGIRELAVDGHDLLILAGPTMTHDGALRVFRLHKPGALDDDSVTGQDEKLLKPLFDLPFGIGGDYAEGLAVTSWHDQPAVLVVHDSPLRWRRPDPGTVLADIYHLPR
ncbi:MAG: DUF3616 domain-containing protein [Defluviicoccus sp.]|nr:MAG: DUF3616 domain-containing protein [Defluviicoccus sp.]